MSCIAQFAGMTEKVRIYHMHAAWLCSCVWDLLSFCICQHFLGNSSILLYLENLLLIMSL